MPPQVPPHSIEAERACLGNALVIPTSFEELTDLLVDDFFMPAHREIFESMLELNRRGKPIDVVMLIDELKAKGMLSRLDGGESYLLHLANEPFRPDNLHHYAKMVADRAAQRRLIAACVDVASTAYGEVYDVQELLAEARRKVIEVETSGKAGGPVHIGETLDVTLQSLEDRAINPGSYFVQTGIRQFDERIGGVRGGNMVVIATRPGMGKSAWLMDILLHNAECGVPSLVFSMEMTVMEIHERLLAKKASVNGRSITSGKMTPKEWGLVDAAANKLRDLPIWIDSRDLTAPRICSEARRWRTRQKCTRAIFGVDYLGLVKAPDTDERNRAAEVALMTRSFKKLAVELDDPVFLVAQLNRENVKDKRRPRISDLRDSGSIEQDANTVIFPWWEGTPNPLGRHAATLIVGKNRGGVIGDVEVDWVPEYIRFEDTLDNQQRQRNFA